MMISFAILMQNNGINAAEVQNFCSDWEFVKNDIKIDETKSDKLNWQPVTLPHTWNNKDAQSGGKYYAGIGCYRKKFFVDASQKGKLFFIRFEGVGAVADVYVNGILVGNHKGAYSAFCLEITPALQFGKENIILVKADNALRPDVIPVTHSLFMVFGGIYRPVSLIITDPIHITRTDYASSGIYISQKDVSRKSAAITVKTKIKNGLDLKHDLTIKTIIKDTDGRTKAETKDIFTVRPTVVTTILQKIKVKKPHLWNARIDPYLYQLTVEVFDGERLVDSATQPLGIRYYSMDPDRGFILNGKPYRLYGVCRHQDRKDYGSALTEAQHIEDFDLIYEMGATSVRLAHYQQSDTVYSYCDKKGIVAWAEIPFVNRYTGKERDNAKQQMLELVRQNFNHPSIFIWGLHNEVYARRSTDYPVLLTEELHDICKSEDPDRFTVSTSGYGSLERPMDLHADLQGCNRYFGWYYGKVDGLANWIEGTKTKHPGSFVSIAEYGCGGNIAHQTETPTRANPGSGKFFSEQYQTTMHEVQWADIEAHPYIWGSYLWNMFDFNVPGWNRGGIKGLNHKGLVTYDRSTKKDSFYFYKANWSDEPVLYIRDRRLINRTQLQTLIKIYSNCDNVELQINGKKAELNSNGYAIFSSNAILKNGKNIISVKAHRDGKTYTDKCTWNVDTSIALAKIKADADKTVIASGYQDDGKSTPENTIDGNPKTYWTTDNKDPWIRYALTDEIKVSRIGIQWYAGDQRTYPFEIETSFDGLIWQEVYKGQNNHIASIDYCSFAPATARYVRIKCHGNNKTGFSAIYEVDLQGLKKQNNTK